MTDEAVRDARAFHEAYERLAPSFGYETRKASAVPWDEVPEQNRALMIAVCAEVVGAIRASERAKVEALLEAAESTIAAADESRAQARAQWEAQMTTGFPCRTCGAPARHWEHGMSGNWNSQPASYPACNDHATFYHFYSADLSGIRAAIDAVRAGRAS